MSDAGRPRSSIVPVRFGERDLEIVERASAIMGDRSLSAFTREAALVLARAILEASASVGGRSPGAGWRSVSLKGEIARKPEGAP